MSERKYHEVPDSKNVRVFSDHTLEELSEGDVLCYGGEDQELVIKTDHPRSNDFTTMARCNEAILKYRYVYWEGVSEVSGDSYFGVSEIRCLGPGNRDYARYDKRLEEAGL